MLFNKHNWKEIFYSKKYLNKFNFTSQEKKDFFDWFDDIEFKNTLNKKFNDENYYQKFGHLNSLNDKANFFHQFDDKIFSDTLKKKFSDYNYTFSDYIPFTEFEKNVLLSNKRNYYLVSDIAAILILFISFILFNDKVFNKSNTYHQSYSLTKSISNPKSLLDKSIKNNSSKIAINKKNKILNFQSSIETTNQQITSSQNYQKKNSNFITQNTFNNTHKSSKLSLSKDTKLILSKDTNVSKASNLFLSIPYQNFVMPSKATIETNEELLPLKSSVIKNDNNSDEKILLHTISYPLLMHNQKKLDIYLSTTYQLNVWTNNVYSNAYQTNILLDKKINNHFHLLAGIGFQQLTLKNFSLLIHQQKTYSFDIIYHYYYLNYKNINYLNIPVSFYYQLNSKNLFGAGVGINYTLAGKGFITDKILSQESSSNDIQYSSYYFSDGLKKWYYSSFISYTYRLKTLDFFINYNFFNSKIIEDNLSINYDLSTKLNFQIGLRLKLNK